MTVGELIEKLSRFDPALEVDADGCDCIEDAADAYPWERYGELRILIARDGTAEEPCSHTTYYR